MARKASAKLADSRGAGLIEVLLVLAISAVITIVSFRFIQTSGSAEVLTSKFQAYIYAVKQAANAYFASNCNELLAQTASNSLTDAQLFAATDQPPVTNPILDASTAINYVLEPNTFLTVKYLVIQITTTFPSTPPVPLIVLAGETQGTNTNNQITWQFVGGVNQQTGFGLDPVSKAAILFQDMRTQIKSDSTVMVICNVLGS